MYTRIILTTILCLCSSVIMAQVPVDEIVIPGSTGGQGPTGRGLYTKSWEFDVQALTGDERCLGVEFDGTYFWVTGADDYYSGAHLYKIDKDNNKVVQDFLQPNGQGWGWRDLALDDNYLYAGDPRDGQGGMINKISKSTGNVYASYGPVPLKLCRAIAYDETTDSFWVGNEDEPIYQCFRNGNYNTYDNNLLKGIFGMAIEEVNVDNPTRKLWIWSQDGTYVQATEFDIETGAFTGETFQGDAAVGGYAGGACARDTGKGWELITMHQTTSDTLVAYGLSSAPLTNEVIVINVATGGKVDFKLNAGISNAHRTYILFTGMSGSEPGTPLPGEQCILPLNWDPVTCVFLNILNTPMCQQFAFYLDADGKSTATLDTLGPLPGGSGLVLTFAFALMNPWTFVSNPTKVTLQ